MATEWESVLNRLSLIEIRTREDCSNPSQFTAFLQNEPKLAGFKLESKEWETEDEAYPVVPVAFMAEYVSHWFNHREGLSEYFYTKLFGGPLGIDTVKVKLMAVGEEKYTIVGGALAVDKIRTEFKLGLLSIFATPVFEFWLGREAGEVLYNGGNPGIGESFETFFQL